MLEENKPCIIYVDTSYLTHMPASEKADWNRLLEYAKSCIGNLNVYPRVEIHISEIALRERRGKMIDELSAAIAKTSTQINALQRKWHGSEIAKGLDYPFPEDSDIFPSGVKIQEAADKYIDELLKSGVISISIKEHHKEAVWANYFNWEPPFDKWPISERDNPEIREKRRLHIPDAWILEAAIDAQKLDHKMLCLCDDGPLAVALTGAQHQSYKSAKEIWDIIFPPSPPPSIEQYTLASDEVTQESQKPLDVLLSKTINENISNIYLRLLGFVAPLNTPSHDTLVEAVERKGYDKRLIEACAIMLSDASKPYIVNTGSHYIAGDKAICNEASSRLTSEIIEMLDEENHGH